MSEGRNLAMAVRAAYLTMHREADLAFREAGLTANQFVVLWALTREPMTQNALAKHIASDRNTIRPILLSLEKQKLISRSPHPSDGRALIVRLTAKGRKRFEQCHDLDRCFLNRLTSPLSDQETDTLIDLLERIRQVMGDDRADTPTQKENPTAASC